jgi:hypothetical protein
MGYKIAVATSDGIHIDLHFGQTDYFAIYQVNEDGSYEQLEQRKSGTKDAIACDTGIGHYGGGQKKDERIESIADCRCVLCARSKADTETELSKRRITAFIMEKGIDEALEKVIRYYRNFSSLVSFRRSDVTQQ